MMEGKKLCVDCKTTKTPLWRTGPHGPRSLCNACGIRYRKRKIIADKNQNQSSDKPHSISNTIDGDHVEFKIRMNEPSNHVLEPTSPSSSSSSSWSSSSASPMKRQRSRDKREMGEVEQAALLLMLLSYGSVMA